MGVERERNDDDNFSTNAILNIFKCILNFSNGINFLFSPGIVSRRKVLNEN